MKQRNPCNKNRSTRAQLIHSSIVIRVTAIFEDTDIKIEYGT